ncbi:MAG: hypothetical protein ACI4AK_07600 [Lepagella sp.]
MRNLLSLSILLFGMLLPFSCSGANGNGNAAKSQGSSEIVPRNDADILMDYNWTDGSVIYSFYTSETPHVATHPLENREKFDRYLFSGGTLHEGGYGLCLDHYKGDMWVSADPDDGNYYPLRGCDVKFSGGRDALLFYDAMEGNLIETLVVIDGSDVDKGNNKKYLEQDIVRYLLGGKYKTREGKTVEFDAEKMKTYGTLFGEIDIRIGYAYDMPMPVLIINGKYYYIEKVLGGINLIGMDFESDDDCCGNTRTGESYDLLRTDEDFWPDLSKKILTKTELLYYAGYSPDGPFDDEEIAERISKRSDMYDMMLESIKTSTTEAAKMNMQSIEALKNRCVNHDFD